MTHPILAKIDDLDAAIGGSTDLTMPQANTHRAVLSAFKRDLFADLDRPKQGATEIVGGATITHRPDLVEEERRLQVQQQGDADGGGYLPARRETLAKEVRSSKGGTIQAPEPVRPAEPAKIGAETR